MKTSHRVLFLSDKSSTLLPPLELLCDAHSDLKIKFVAPDKLYKTDFDESEFIMLDYDYYLKNPELLEIAFQYPDKLSIFATLTDHQQMNEILKKTKVSHLFGMSGTHTLADMKAYLVASIEKKFWTAETFINPPATKKSHTEFHSSDHLDEQIESAIQTHDLSNTFEGFRAILIQILNESLTNALYNAPIDSNGNFLHRHQNRREVITSEQKKCPTIDIVEDEDKIVLSIRDYYGTLTKEVIDHYLTHGEVAEKDGGAGVGMFIVLKHAHKMIINLDPGKMTEFIIVLHKFKRFYHYQTLEKSFHLYQRKSS
jgi:hypothetical protein